jgi:hypothetical protein
MPSPLPPVSHDGHTIFLPNDFFNGLLAVMFALGLVDFGWAGVVQMPVTGDPGMQLQLAAPMVSHIGSFGINVNAGSGLSGNSAALAAFNRAANQWVSRIADPITVNIAADMANLGGGGIIGQSNTLTLVGAYSTIRDAMVADAVGEADDGIVASLPSGGASFWVPSTFSLSGNLRGSKANLKALGFTGLDTQFGATDATITFNTQFSFDFDNSNGVTPGTMDFETVAAHEIGHALGFLSEVDTADLYLGQAVSLSPTTLDMFRFWNIPSENPSNAAQFNSFPRSLLVGDAAITDQIDTQWGTLVGSEFGMSTGYYHGDHRQASHWKDDDLTLTFIGLMDPTLGYTQVHRVGEADLRALDLIGYEVAPAANAVPEPGTMAIFLGLVGAWAVACRLRRKRAA